MATFKLDSDASSPGANRVIDRCETLSQLSSLADGVCRTYLSDQHRAAHDQVVVWMQQASMDTWMDAAGNTWGRYKSQRPDAPVVILGSHLDTVVNAGKYDGILGVLAAIEVVDQFNRNQIRLPFTIEVVGFADEEGTRFGATLLGSRAVAGTWDSQWAQLKDSGGITLASAMESFGLYVDKVPTADRSKARLMAYLELHIEQGPVLEEHNEPVGIVTAIAGARRFLFRLKGMAGHAGTVPMEMRRDPLVAAGKIIDFIDRLANRYRIVATVGKMHTSPGAVNVIPGSCEFSLDIRSGNDTSRDQALEGVMARAEEVCSQRNIELSIEEIHNAPAVRCASWIQRISEQVIIEEDMEPVSLISGAGHDAMAFSGITDIGMLFVRCKAGISHHPAESVTVEDVHAGLNVFYKTVLKLVERV